MVPKSGPSSKRDYPESIAADRFSAALRGAFETAPVKAKPEQESKPKKKPAKASS